MSNKENSASGWLFKSSIFAAIIGVLYFFFNGAAASTPSPSPDTRDQTEKPTKSSSEQNLPDITIDPSATAVVDQGLEEYLPAQARELVRHKYFSLSYNEDHEQADWVVYRITRERLNNSTIERSNHFLPDPAVRTESATPRDYNGSGYDRGHLCPAADMAFDQAAMDETFYMSNMSPQDQAFNGGIWRELEELTRDWGRRYEKIIVVTGPVLKENGLKTIGFSKVSVPRRFYRVILTKDKTIGFILPNEVSERPVMDFACSVDEVERATGLDFFPKVLDGLNEELESLFDRKAWPVQEDRYQKRVADWNKK
jgi:endonuclease G, mitochondrial